MTSAAVRILLIDDDEFSFHATRAMLNLIQGESYDLQWASSYEAGLDQLRLVRHDACLLDYQLGDHDGLELLRQAASEGCRVPIIMLTGSSNQQVDRQAMKMGATDFLDKATINATRLERAIRYAIERRRSLDLLEQRAAELNRSQEELCQAKEAAELANRAKSEFLANMSHEIRTPLNAVIGLTEIVLNGELDDTHRRDYLGTILDSAESLLSVINDILDFSKIEAGKIDFEHVSFNLQDMVGDTLKTLARAHHKKLEIACFVAPNLPDIFIGDPGRIRQVITNLVSNAIKFTDRGEIVVRVEQESFQHGQSTLHFTVKDTGMGIPREKVGRIFEAFEQADTSTTRRFGGTGLGLSISKKLVSLLGGRIWVESEYGSGSTFHFTTQFEVLPDQQQAARHQPLFLKNTRVLIVDDNATNRTILDAVVRAKGMRPTLFESALEAFTELNQALDAGDPYRLVLTDVNMPGTDGFELAKMIREDERFSSVEILFLTSAARPSDPQRCDELRVAARLMKPVKQSDLFDAIVRSLGITRPEDDGWLNLVPRHVPSSKPLRILLAEDSIPNQKLALAILDECGHKTVVAHNGNQVLSLLAAEEFDVVLMDIQMPQMDGFETTAAIRAAEHSTGRHLPLIAMTAHALAGDREKCLEAGMDDYVAKPIHRQELFNALARAIRQATELEPVSEENPSTSKLVDWSISLRQVDGNHDLLRDIVKLFLEEIRDVVKNLPIAIAAGDARETRRLAHTLHSAMRMFGARDACQLAQELENLVRSGDMTHGMELLTRQMGDVDLIQATLLDFVNTGEM